MPTNLSAIRGKIRAARRYMRLGRSIHNQHYLGVLFMSNLILLRDWYESNIEIWISSSVPNYDVSSWGRVRSYWHKVRGVGHRGGFRSVLGSEPRILNPKPNKAHGYVEVYLHRDGRGFNQRLHRLIAEAFHGQSNLPDVNHRNSIKIDNRAENLEWLSKRSHCELTQAAGLQPHGEAHGCSKLTVDSVRNIRKAKAKGVSTYTLASLYSVNSSTIIRIGSGQSWRHVV